jgi:hypothetical protein
MLKMWVDPPSGWVHGFPKVYDPAVDGEDIRAWLVLKGYPESHADFACKYLRMWGVEENVG